MTIRQRGYAAACAGFAIHAILVGVVMRICQTDPDPSIILFWRLVWFADWPASLVVDFLEPGYNVPLALAFAIIGGLQWSLITVGLYALWQRLKAAQ